MAAWKAADQAATDAEAILRIQEYAEFSSGSRSTQLVRECGELRRASNQLFLIRCFWPALWHESEPLQDRRLCRTPCHLNVFAVSPCPLNRS
jgi:hypothetical protein